MSLGSWQAQCRKDEEASRLDVAGLDAKSSRLNTRYDKIGWNSESRQSRSVGGSGVSGRGRGRSLP